MTVYCNTNTTDIITKCASNFITKWDRCSLQNVSGFLLQSATDLLQNAIVIPKCHDFITKCNSYHKMRRLLQIATGQCILFVLVIAIFEDLMKITSIMVS